MTGNITVPSSWRIDCPDEDTSILFHTDGTVRIVMDGSVGTYRPFNCSVFKSEGYLCLANAGTFKAAPGYGNKIDLQGHGGAWTTIATLYGESALDADDARFAISRAGDIFPAVASCYDVGSATHPFATAHIDVVWVKTKINAPYVRFDIFTDATRGAAGIQGRVIYNDDDQGLNIDDGISWRDTNGNIT